MSYLSRDGRQCGMSRRAIMKIFSNTWSLGSAPATACWWEYQEKAWGPMLLKRTNLVFSLRPEALVGQNLIAINKISSMALLNTRCCRSTLYFGAQRTSWGCQRIAERQHTNKEKTRHKDFRKHVAELANMRQMQFDTLWEAPNKKHPHTHE